MRNLKTYKLFEKSQEITPEQREWLDTCSTAGNRHSKWSINPLGMIDVDHDFYAHGSNGTRFSSNLRKNLTGFLGLKFGKVWGGFFVNDTAITTLEGSPSDVGGSFHCEQNSLESLEGAPERVGRNFVCSGNTTLKSLKGAPREIGYEHTYDENDLYPSVFDCSLCDLKNLEGSPEYIPGDFKCEGNPLVSLKGAPRVIERNFYTRTGLGELKSLYGAPEKVGGSFICNDFTLYNGTWGTSESYTKLFLGVEDDDCKIYASSERMKLLMTPYVTDDLVDSFFKENPLEIGLLDGYPEIKAEVLKRTGLRDMSSLGQALRKKMI